MKNKLFYGFFTIQMTIFLLLLQLLFFYTFISIQSFESTKDILNRNVFRLTDNFVGDSETELYANKIGLQLLKQFHKEISNNNYFEYYEIISQPVYIPYWDNNDIFIEGYENEHLYPTANINKNITAYELLRRNE